MKGWGAEEKEGELEESEEEIKVGWYDEGKRSSLCLEQLWVDKGGEAK